MQSRGNLQDLPAEEMMAEADIWRQGQKEKNKQSYEIRRNRRVEGLLKGIQRRFTGGCLRDIEPGDKLYIMLHGPGQADGFLGATRKNGMKRYMPEQLARALQREGLAKKPPRHPSLGTQCDGRVGSTGRAKYQLDGMAGRGDRLATPIIWVASARESR